MSGLFFRSRFDIAVLLGYGHCLFRRPAVIRIWVLRGSSVVLGKTVIVTFPVPVLPCLGDKTIPFRNKGYNYD